MFHATIEKKLNYLFTQIKMGGSNFYIYVWAFMFCFSVFMMTIVPVVIMPIFNTYEPLKDGELKTSIYKLAVLLNYPLKKLFVMDGSKRSSHSNAFMFGFGSNKRIGKNIIMVIYARARKFCDLVLGLVFNSYLIFFVLSMIGLTNFYPYIYSYLFLHFNYYNDTNLVIFDTLLEQVKDSEILAILVSFFKLDCVM